MRVTLGRLWNTPGLLVHILREEYCHSNSKGRALRVPEESCPITRVNAFKEYQSYSFFISYLWPPGLPRGPGSSRLGAGSWGDWPRDWGSGGSWGPGPGEVGVGSWVAWPRAAQPHCPVSTLGPNSGLTRKPGLFPAQ